VPDGALVRVKICCVRRAEDAREAVAAGADYVGALLSPGFGRSVEAHAAARFLEGAGATLVAVVVDAGVQKTVRLARAAGAGVIQLHGSEPPEALRALREEGNWRLWKATRVRGASDLEQAFEQWGDVADGILLDGFREGSVGGTGTTFPWESLESLRGSLPERLELIVAGGLTPENVAEAVARLAPDVVDVSSGVEASLGVKDPAKVRAFVANARASSPGEHERLRRAGGR
jgi:phosphoribosylanthranilate isomerase